MHADLLCHKGKQSPDSPHMCTWSISVSVLVGYVLFDWQIYVQVCYGEPWTWLALVLPVLIVVSWVFAFRFFGTVTEWKVCMLYSKGDARDPLCVVSWI